MSLAAQSRILIVWLRALWFWLTEPRHFWLATFVVALALVFALRRGTTEPEIRISGLLLQILGIGTVAWGIRETRALFGRPTLVAESRATGTRPGHPQSGRPGGQIGRAHV